MPLERFAETIARLRAEEEERSARQQREALQLQTSPGMSNGPILDDFTRQQMQQFIDENPPPKPDGLTTISNVLRRLGARFSGRPIPEWVEPYDPLAKTRENMVMEIARQGMKRQGDKALEDYKQPNRIKLKQTAPGVHPSQEAANYGNAAQSWDKVRTPEERYLEYLKMRQEYEKGGLELGAMQEDVPVARDIRANLRRKLQGGQPPPSQPVTGGADPITANLQANRPPMPPAKGRPPLEFIGEYPDMESARAALGEGVDATGKEAVGFEQPSTVEQMRQQNRYEPDISADLNPGGKLTYHYKERLTQEAEQAKEREKAQIQHDYSSPGEETLKRFELINQAMNTAKLIARDVKDEDVGPLANAFAEYRKYAGQLSPQHERLRANIMSLNNLVGYIKSGANITVTEQDMNEHILPNLWSGKPVYFRNALTQVQNELAERMRLMGKLQKANRGTLGQVAEEQINEPAPALGQSTTSRQPANYPKGAPPGLVYDQRIGKWRMP